MATFLHDSTRAFKNYGDPTTLPTKRRSEARLKNYGSATDARAWVNNEFDEKKYLMELMGMEAPKQIQVGKYVPIDALINTLLANKNADIAELERQLKELEALLTPEQRKEAAKLKAAGDARKPQIIPFEREPSQRSASTDGVSPRGAAKPGSSPPTPVESRTPRRSASAGGAQEEDRPSVRSAPGAGSSQKTPTKSMTPQRSVIIAGAKDEDRESRRTKTGQLTPVERGTPQRSAISGLGKEEAPVERGAPQRSASTGLGKDEAKTGQMTPVERRTPQRSATSGLGKDEVKTEPMERRTPQRAASSGLGKDEAKTGQMTPVERTPQRAASSGLGQDETKTGQITPVERRTPQRSASGGLGKDEVKTGQMTPVERGAPQRSASPKDEDRDSRRTKTRQMTPIEKGMPERSDYDQDAPRGRPESTPKLLERATPQRSASVSQTTKIKSDLILDEGPSRGTSRQKQVDTKEEEPRSRRKRSIAHDEFPARSEDSGIDRGARKEEEEGESDEPVSTTQMGPVAGKVGSAPTISTRAGAAPRTRCDIDVGATKAGPTRVLTAVAPGSKMRDDNEADAVKRELNQQRDLARKAIEQLEALKDIVDERDNLVQALRRSQEELDDLKVKSLSMRKRDSCDIDIKAMEEEISNLKGSGKSDEVEVIYKELQLLKKYCVKLNSIKEENERLKSELEEIKNETSKSEHKIYPNKEEERARLDKLKAHHQDVVNISDRMNKQRDPTFKDDEDEGNYREQVELLKDKVVELNTVTKERNRLQEQVNDLEGQLATYGNLTEEVEVFKRRSQMLDNVMDEKNDLQRRLDKMKGLEDEVSALKKKAARVDQLEQELNSRRGLSGRSKEKQDMSKDSIEKMKDLEKEVQMLRLERDRAKMRISELGMLEKDYKDTKQKLSQLQSPSASTKPGDLQKILDELRNKVNEAKELENERSALTRRVRDLECVIADQEGEINRLVSHVDRLSRGQEKQQEHMKRVAGELRDEIDKKSNIIAQSEQQLALVQDQLKSTIDEVSHETNGLLEKVDKSEKRSVELEHALNKTKDENEELRKNLQEKEQSLSSLESKLGGIQQDNSRLQNIADRMRDLTDNDKLAMMVSKSKTAAKRVGSDIKKKMKHKEKKSGYINDDEKSIEEECIEWMERCKMLEEALDNARNTQVGKEAENLALRRHSNEIQEIAKDQIHEMAAEVKRLQDELKACHEASKILNNQADTASLQKTAALEEEVQRLTQELETGDNCRQQLKECTKQLERVNAQLEDQRRCALELEEARREIDRLSNEDSCIKELKAIKTQLLEMSEKIKAAKAEEAKNGPTSCSKKLRAAKLRLLEMVKHLEDARAAKPKREGGRCKVQLENAKRSLAEMALMLEGLQAAQSNQAGSCLEQFNQYNKLIDDLQRQVASTTQAASRPDTNDDCEEQLRNLQKMLDASNKQIENLNRLLGDNARPSTITSAPPGNEEALAQNKDLRDKLHDCTEQLAEYKRRLEDLQNQLAKPQSIALEKPESLDDALKQIEDLKAKLAAAKAMFDDCKAELNRPKSSEKEIEDLKAQLALQKAKYDECMAQLKESAPKKSVHLKEEPDSLADALKQIEDLKAKLAAALANNEELAAGKSRTKRSLGEPPSNELDDLKAQLAAQKEKYEECMKQLERAKRNLSEPTVEAPGNLDDALKQIDELKRKLKDSNGQLQDCREDLGDCRKKLEECKLKLEECKKQLVPAGDSDAAKQIEDLRAQLAAQKAKYEECMAQLEKGAKAGKEPELKQPDSLADALKQIEELKKKLQECKAELAKSSGDNKELDDLKKKLKDAQDELATAKAQAPKSTDDASQKEVDNLKKQLADLKKELAECRDKLASKEKELSASKNLDDCLKQIEDLKKKLGDAQKELETAKQQGPREGNEDLKKKLADALKEIEDLKKQLKEAQDLNKKLADSSNEIEDLKKKLAECQKELKAAKEQTAPAVAPSSKSANLDDAVKQIEELKRKLESCLKENEDLKKQLAKAKEEKPAPPKAGNLDDALKQNEDLKKKLADFEDLKKKLENALKEIEDLKKQLAQSKSVAALPKPGNLDDALKQIEDLKKKLENALKEIEDLKKQLAQSKVEKPAVAALPKPGNLDDALKQIEDLKKKTADFDDLKRKLENAMKEIEGLKKELAQIEDLKRQLANCKGDLEECRKKLAAQSQPVASTKLEAGDGAKQIEDLKAQLKKCRDELAAAEKREQECKAQLANAQKDLAKKMSVSGLAKPGNLDDALKQIQDLKDKLNAAKAQLATLEDCQKQLAECRKQLEEARKMAKDGGAAAKDIENLRKQLDVKKERPDNVAERKELFGAMDKLGAQLEGEEKRDRGKDDRVGDKKDIEKQLKGLEEELKKQKRESMDTLNMIKSQHDRDLKNLHDKYRSSMEKLQSSHEDLFNMGNRELEREMGELRRQNKALMAEIERLKAELAGKPRPSLSKSLQRMDVLGDDSQVCHCGDNRFAALLRKVLRDGLESLQFEDLQYLHTKVCDATANMMGAGALTPDDFRKMPPTVADGDLKRRQKIAQGQVAKLQLEVAMERSRLEDLKRTLQIEKETNNELARMIRSQTRTVSSFKTALEKEQSRSEQLERTLQVERDMTRQLSSMLGPTESLQSCPCAKGPVHVACHCGGPPSSATTRTNSKGARNKRV